MQRKDILLLITTLFLFGLAQSKDLKMSVLEEKMLINNSIRKLQSFDTTNTTAVGNH